MSKTAQHAHSKLGQLFSTAICGNDILSSALYVSGIAITFGGIYAPLVLAAICLVLFFYKSVYTEVVEALPLNGGAYNCLLNSTSKVIAAIAGVMTVLSYVATAVISAKVGVSYLVRTFPNLVPTGVSSEDAVIGGTILLLFLFALLVIGGIKDSARVAFGIFAFHIGVLIAFLVYAFLDIHTLPSFFAENLASTKTLLQNQGGLSQTLFLAFSASLLGVSGFESSANFVEEQQKGVFRKTLRNMLIGVAIFNPLIAVVILNYLPYDAISSAKDFLLEDAARTVGGNVFAMVMGINAFMVLSGAVLTSFVGVSGLVSRMAADACLPNLLSKQNKRGSYSRIVVSFFLLCSSILLITHGDLLSLAGVYTIAFLGVMSLFAIGNLILRETRSQLKRTYSAPLIFVLLAFTATFLGIWGNIRIDVQNVRFFELYFVPALFIVLAFIFQDKGMEFLLKKTTSLPWIHNYILKNYEDVISGTYVAFIHKGNRLAQILNYVDRNETSKNIILIYCTTYKKAEDDPLYNEIKIALPILKKAGVTENINVTLRVKHGEFNPKMIDDVSEELKIRKNRILIGSIHHTHPFDYDELGGVRIVA